MLDLLSSLSAPIRKRSSPVTGPPRYATAAIMSTLQPNRLSQAFARSSPAPLLPVPALPLLYEPEPYAADSGSFEYAWGTDEGSDRLPPDWYEF